MNASMDIGINVLIVFKPGEPSITMGFLRSSSIIKVFGNGGLPLIVLFNIGKSF